MGNEYYSMMTKKKVEETNAILMEILEEIKKINEKIEKLERGDEKNV